MIRTFIQMSVMMLTVEASFFLLKANLGLSAKTIAKLGSTCFEYNGEVLRNLAEQSENTRVGLFLLLLSFVLQMGNTLWPLRWDDFGIDWSGVLASIVFCIVVMVISYLYGCRNSKKLFDRSMEIIKSRSQLNSSKESSTNRR